MVMSSSLMIANIINGLGVAGLLLAHFYISDGQARKGFFISSAGALMVATGSYILGSWPIVFLNLVWFALGLFGGFKNPSERGLPSLAKLCIVLSTLLLFLGLGLVLKTGSEIPAWMASFMYLGSFYLLATGRIKPHHYLLVCLMGYLLLIQHLWSHGNYAVLFNETIAATISVFGLCKYMRAKIFSVIDV